MLTMVIIAFNSILLSALLERYRAAGDQKAITLLRKKSPVAWQHVHFLGRYLFRGNRPPIDLVALLLDGLMHHESSIDIREHYTDTAGAIDHVFGLCHLLGIRRHASCHACRHGRARVSCILLREPASSSRTALELLDEPQQMGVDDLLGGGDFLELPIVGRPAHPLRLGHIVADAAVRPELAPKARRSARSCGASRCER
jgi:hypothetical protein